MIDNYDSFTYNLVQYFGELGEEIRVFRNDKITIQEIEKLDPERIVISPGPCTPKEAGISIEVVRHFAGDDSDSGGMPWPSIHRRRIRRGYHTGPKAYARKDFIDSPRRQNALQGAAESVRSNAVSFPPHKKGDPP